MAPRAVLQEVAAGEANFVNVESSAFIVADAWFCLITVVGGLITGVLGYRFGVRRAGWVAAAESGKSAEKALNAGARLETREAEKSFLFETARVSAPSAPVSWVHRNYLAK